MSSLLRVRYLFLSFFSFSFYLFLFVFLSFFHGEQCSPIGFYAYFSAFFRPIISYLISVYIYTLSFSVIFCQICYNFVAALIFMAVKKNRHFPLSPFFPRLCGQKILSLFYRLFFYMSAKFTVLVATNSLSFLFNKY